MQAPGIQPEEVVLVVRDRNMLTYACELGLLLTTQSREMIIISKDGYETITISEDLEC